MFEEDKGPPPRCHSSPRWPPQNAWDPQPGLGGCDGDVGQRVSQAPRYPTPRQAAARSRRSTANERFMGAAAECQNYPALMNF